MGAELITTLRAVASSLTTIAHVAGALGIVLAALAVVAGIRGARRYAGGVVAGAVLASVAPSLVRWIGGTLGAVLLVLALSSPALAQTADPPPWYRRAWGTVVDAGASVLNGAASAVGLNSDERNREGAARVATALAGSGCVWCAAAERATTALLAASRQVAAALVEPVRAVASAALLVWLLVAAVRVSVPGLGGVALVPQVVAVVVVAGAAFAVLGAGAWVEDQVLGPIVAALIGAAVQITGIATSAAGVGGSTCAVGTGLAALSALPCVGWAAAGWAVGGVTLGVTALAAPGGSILAVFGALLSVVSALALIIVYGVVLLRIPALALGVAVRVAVLVSLWPVVVAAAVLPAGRARVAALLSGIVAAVAEVVALALAGAAGGALVTAALGGVTGANASLALTPFGTPYWLVLAAGLLAGGLMSAARSAVGSLVGGGATLGGPPLLAGAAGAAGAVARIAATRGLSLAAGFAGRAGGAAVAGATGAPVVTAGAAALTRAFAGGRS